MEKTGELKQNLQSEKGNMHYCELTLRESYR